MGKGRFNAFLIHARNGGPRRKRIDAIAEGPIARTRPNFVEQKPQAWHLTFRLKEKTVAMKTRLWLVPFVGAAALSTGCIVRERVYVPPPQPPPPVVVQQPAPPPVVVQPGQPPPPVTVVEPAPPPPQTEVIVAAPGPGFVWNRGYWDWNGAAWVWFPGVWVRPPWHGAVWLGGRWDHRHGRAVWVRAGWR